MRQTCKHCGRADKFNFHVPDEEWEKIVPSHLQNRVVCLACFDDFAATLGQHYGLTSLFFAGDQVTMEFELVRAS